MKKFLFILILGLFVLWLVCLTSNNGQNRSLPPVGVAQAATATTGVTLTTTVLEAIAINITSGATIAFGNLTPGTPLCAGISSALTVTTNASNGYTIGLHDGSDTNSPLVFNTTNFIPDATGGSLATPLVWSTGSAGFQGLGVSNYADATTKETKWGTGTTVCDVWNKYSFAPAATAPFHTVTGYRAAADNSTWGWKIDAPGTQITGAYSGVVTFTATSVVA